MFLKSTIRLSLFLLFFIFSKTFFQLPLSTALFLQKWQFNSQSTQILNPKFLKSILGATYAPGDKPALISMDLLARSNAKNL